jgi:hypothetical protein
MGVYSEIYAGQLVKCSQLKYKRRKLGDGQADDRSSD